MNRSTPFHVIGGLRMRILIAALVTALAAAVFPASAGAIDTAPNSTLVLYDSSGPWGHLGEQYGILTHNLMSRFGTVTSRPVASYTDNQMDGFRRVVYLGSTYDEPLPTHFLDDVLGGQTEVMWIGFNIWQLHDRAAANGSFFVNDYGWQWSGFDTSSVPEVLYKNVSFTRSPLNAGGIMNTASADPTKYSVLATAKRADGTTFPWALRTVSKRFTYVGEVPFAYMSENDRYVAFAGILQDLYEPAGAVRRRAFVRIEDVGPDADPKQLKEIADYLRSQRIPFMVTVYSTYRDPLGVYNNGVPTQYSLRDRPEVVKALKDMRSKGGVLLFHGWTHQLDSYINPYDAASGNDFEFWMAHVDANDTVVYDGPVPGDSVQWAQNRMNNATAEFAAVGLAKPTSMVFPHYAASAADYEAARRNYSQNYGRSIYFNGLLSGGYQAADYSKGLVGQFFPYTGVTDVYGLRTIPENLGNIEPEAFNNHPARFPADLVASARRNLALKDSVASFFYHPYLGRRYLEDTVKGIRALGYTFTLPTSS